MVKLNRNNEFSGLGTSEKLADWISYAKKCIKYLYLVQYLCADVCMCVRCVCECIADFLIQIKYLYTQIDNDSTTEERFLC